MKLLLIVSFILLNITCWGQSTIEWQSCYGGQDNDRANSIEQTSDGGYIVAGRSDSWGWGSLDDDIWIVKVDNSGSLEWEAAYGGSGHERPHEIKQTSDGGYIIAGQTNSSDGDVSTAHGYNDAWIIKLSNSGTIEWEKSFGGSLTDVASSVQQTNDGGYIIGGYSYSNDGDLAENYGGTDYWVIKLDSIGLIVWNKTYGGSGFDYSKTILQTSDSGYIIIGNSGSEDHDISYHFGNWDLWLIKISNAGIIQWERSLGGLENDLPSSIQQIIGGGYIISGYSESNEIQVSNNHGQFDAWIVKLDCEGNFDWQRSVGGSLDDYAYSARQTSDGGFIVTGTTESNDGDVSNNYGSRDLWVFKLGNNGYLCWEKTFGSTEYDSGFCVRETSDNGCIIAGTSFSIDGDITNNNGNHDYWVVKLSNVLGTEDETQETIGVYPNPAIDEIRIGINNSIQDIGFIIFDCAGISVQSGILNQENQTIDIRNLPVGMYIVNVQSIDKQYNIRFIKH